MKFVKCIGSHEAEAILKGNEKRVAKAWLESGESFDQVIARSHATYLTSPSRVCSVLALKTMLFAGELLTKVGTPGASKIAESVMRKHVKKLHYVSCRVDVIAFCPGLGVSALSEISLSELNRCLDSIE